MPVDFLIFVVILINTILGISVYLRNKTAKTNQFYGIFVLFLNIFIASVFLENRPDIVGEANLELFLRLDFTAAAVYFFAWFRFCSFFSESRLVQNKYKWLNRASVLSLLIIISLTLFTNLILRDVAFYDEVIHL